MNEQMLEQQSEQVLTLEVSDEALEAAAGNELGGPSPFNQTPVCVPTQRLFAC